MGFSGRLEGIAPSDIFQIISQSRMTGTLIARCPDGTGMVVFKKGQVIEAASDAPQESLGHLLVSQGTLSEGTIEAAQELRKQQPDRPLGAILVDMGVIDQKALETVVLKQIGQIVHRLISCDDGFITFDRGEVAVKRKLNTGEFSFPSGLSAEYLIMERVRTIDEDRRRVADRRVSAAAAAAPTSPAAWDGRERRAAGTSGGSAAYRVQKLTARIREFKLPKAEGLRRAVRTVVQKGKHYAGHASDRMRRQVIPWLKTAGSRVRDFSPDGRAMIYAGSGGIAAGIGLLLLFTLAFGTPGSELMITGRVVNLRAKPTTAAKVVAKVERGDTVAEVSFAEGWHEVRTEAGETGWIWQNLAERKESKGPSVNTGTIGAGLVLIAGIALLVVGMMRRRKTTLVEAAP